MNGVDVAHIREIDRKYVAQLFPDPKQIMAVEGRGCMLKTADGKEYLDLIGGIAVTATDQISADLKCAHTRFIAIHYTPLQHQRSCT